MKSPMRPRGLSLVELMVGITVGLIVAAGASMVAVNQITEHRRLMLETQIQQDLRTAADLLQQDLRRAGFRAQASQGVWIPPSASGSLNDRAAVAASANPYAAMERTEDENTRVLTYMYGIPTNATGIPKDNEHFGFKWDKGRQVLSLQLGKDNWQPITDPDTVLITDFKIDIVSPPAESLGDFCDKPCNPPEVGKPPECPMHQVRRVSFTIVGQAVHDRNVVRSLSGVERVRSDAITGACPT
ncbi:PilW family protein [Roseateles cellulosilyticus]|uniref:Prepilin-type N-terminal cleavage/methylation domain-containing protein n=1 Tax=Pelomonas cellulosilytica TaxID=2906762 RepID=A0ABS8XX55_9BURK|nr:prepilin-type N-terminal cleavage/methylation domain-containing protein [Pelomonas sp. P8]MCE4555843.1 prepilin-type N-terminal cleavage/methylation domain-containing protein [Pelomonas sp. P8]